jgi:alkanesulfonate monooxygenase SsuD/methylene tetrahydromethanopterin reductase-like flavin-dependent oxidoreductase (luciferase family)
MTQIGYGLAVAAPEPTILATARAAEASGFSAFWLNHPPNGDGLAPLGRVAAATERISLGTGVIPVSHHSPESILAGVEANALPRDRFRLGIGSGMGAAPLRRVREAIADLRPRAGCEIVLAALGPQMCRLAGEQADAVLLNWMPPGPAGEAAALVLEAAEAAGRPRPGIYAYVRVALGDASLARLEQEGGSYNAIPHYGASFQRMGLAPEETAIRGRSPDEVKEGLRAWDGVVDEVVVRALPAEDREDEALAILEAARGVF